MQKLSFRLDNSDYDKVEVVVCPAFTAVRSVQTTIDGDKMKIGLGAQNCHWEPSGTYTGEVSAPMLAKLNVKYVIVGHSSGANSSARRTRWSPRSCPRCSATE